MKRKIKYKVEYCVLEASYYENSERIYTTKIFDKKQEALDFSEEVKKKRPAQITVTQITEQVLLNLWDTDDYKENRVND